MGFLRDLNSQRQTGFRIELHLTLQLPFYLLPQNQTTREHWMGGKFVGR